MEKGEAKQKQKQRLNKHQNQQTMKSGKAQEGTVSKKRNSCRKEKQGKRRSMGKGEAWEREKHGKGRSMGKGEAEAKEEAEAEQTAELADHKKWESKSWNRVSKKRNSCQKEKHGKRRSTGERRSRGGTSRISRP